MLGYLLGHGADDLRVDDSSVGPSGVTSMGFSFSPRCMDRGDPPIQSIFSQSFLVSWH